MREVARHFLVPLLEAWMKQVLAYACNTDLCCYTELILNQDKLLTTWRLCVKGEVIYTYINSWIHICILIYSVQSYFLCCSSTDWSQYFFSFYAGIHLSLSCIWGIHSKCIAKFFLVTTAPSSRQLQILLQAAERHLRSKYVNKAGYINYNGYIVQDTITFYNIRSILINN